MSNRVLLFVEIPLFISLVVCFISLNLSRECVELVLVQYLTVLAVLIARRYASALYAVVLCLTVPLSEAGTVPKRLNVGSRKQRHTIAKGL